MVSHLDSGKSSYQVGFGDFGDGGHGDGDDGDDGDVHNNIFRKKTEFPCLSSFAFRPLSGDIYTGWKYVHPFLASLQPYLKT